MSKNRDKAKKILSDKQFEETEHYSKKIRGDRALDNFRRSFGGYRCRRNTFARVYRRS